MRWERVDFEQRLIQVIESKTDAGERVVPMFGSARQVLLEQKARSRFKEPQHFVFSTAAGAALDAQNFMVREFYGAMKRANMEKQFRFHGLRHYAVSCLVQQGANVLLVSRVAGHSRPSMTLDVYSHLFDEELAEAALRFDPLGQREGTSTAPTRLTQLNEDRPKTIASNSPTSSEKLSVAFSRSEAAAAVRRSSRSERPARPSS